MLLSVGLLLAGAVAGWLAVDLRPDLRASLASAKDDPETAIMLAYQLTMLTGQTALSDLQNGRYPDVTLEDFAQFAARTMPRESAA